MKLFRNNNSAAMFLIMEGIVFTMIVNLYNPFILMFAKRMGGGDFHTALLNAAPPLVAIFVLIPCGILIERINRKKQTVLVLLAVVSLFYAAIALVPMLPHQAKVLSFVILIGLMNWPGSLYITTWQSYFAEHFRGSYANRIYTVRSKYSTFFGLITVLVTGLLLTNIPRTDEERLILYQIFYGVCFVMTLLQLFLFSKIKTQAVPFGEEPLVEAAVDAKDKAAQAQPTEVHPADGRPDKRLSHKTQAHWFFRKEEFAGMLSNKPFLIFCLCAFAFHLTWQMAWPLFFIYNTDYAHLNEFQLSMTSVASGLTQFLSFSLWNKLIEKKGSNLVIIIGAAGLSLSPLVYTTLVSFPVILALNIFIGIFIAGFTLTLFCSLLETLPQEKKTVYISVFNTITNMTGFMAPFIGVWIYKQTNIFFALGLAGALRLVATSFYFIRWWKGRTKKPVKIGVDSTNGLAG